jgi:hypothetical protein
LCLCSHYLIADGTEFIALIGDESPPPVLPLPSTEDDNGLYRNVLFKHADEPPVMFLPAVEEKAFKFTTFFHGPSRRPYVTLPIKFKAADRKVLPVVFLLDTGINILLLRISLYGIRVSYLACISFRLCKEVQFD